MIDPPGAPRRFGSGPGVAVVRDAFGGAGSDDDDDVVVIDPPGAAPGWASAPRDVLTRPTAVRASGGYSARVAPRDVLALAAAPGDEDASAVAVVREAFGDALERRGHRQPVQPRGGGHVGELCAQRGVREGRRRAAASARAGGRGGGWRPVDGGTASEEEAVVRELPAQAEERQVARARWRDEHEHRRPPELGVARRGAE